MFYNASYGIWTVWNFEMILQLPHDQGCKSNGVNMLELNYEVIIIFGVFPALVTAFFLILGILCAPYLFYIMFANWRNQHERVNSTRNMISHLFRTKYDSNVFKS